jgi:hypothetical protein
MVFLNTRFKVDIIFAQHCDDLFLVLKIAVEHFVES